MAQSGADSDVIKEMVVAGLTAFALALMLMRR